MFSRYSSFSTYWKYAIFVDGDMHTLPLIRRIIQYSFAMKQMLQIEEIVSVIEYRTTLLVPETAL